MSQPAVSNALKRLRISFRDDLFVRTRRGLKPTQRAVELHEAIAPVLESLSHTFDDQTFSPEVSDRTLDISMDIAAEYVFAPDVLGILLPVAPNLRIRFHPDHIPDIAGRLKDGRLNYALGMGQSYPMSLIRLILRTKPCQLFVPRVTRASREVSPRSNTRRFRMCRWSHAPAFLLVKQLEK
ncbi:MAG: LysR family transcriptional regulator [Haliea sp.]|nr:LysR family transcriptional regulator [Haliea sp.]